MEFKFILKDIMQEKGISQTKLAVMSGLRQGQISEWLSGRSIPAYYNLKILCKVLKVSGDEILGLKDDFVNNKK